MSSLSVGDTNYRFLLCPRSIQKATRSCAGLQARLISTQVVAQMHLVSALAFALCSSVTKEAEEERMKRIVRLKLQVLIVELDNAANFLWRNAKRVRIPTDGHEFLEDSYN